MDPLISSNWYPLSIQEKILQTKVFSLFLIPTHYKLEINNIIRDAVEYYGITTIVLPQH